MDSTTINTHFNFLRGGGETGELIRNFNWAATSICAPDQWPAELRNALSLMLNAPIAMCIMWGKDLIQFYNDPFIPSFGQTRHPSAMGQPVKNTSQRWPVVEELFKRVMNGETIYHEDSKIMVDKKGYFEECFFNVSYIPIYLENGTVGGIQSIVLETTDKINALHRLKEDELKIRSLIEKSSNAICLFVGKEMKIDIANDIMINLWGKDKSVIGKPLEEALPELKGQPFLELLDKVFTTGETFEGKAMPAELEFNGEIKKLYFDFNYIAIRNSAGEIYGVMDIATDVTHEVIALKALEESKKQLDFTIQAAELGTWILDPATSKFTGNARLKAWFGLNPDDKIDLQIAINAIAERDRDLVKDAIQKALDISSGGNYEIEYTIINPKTKQEIIVKAKGKAAFDENNKPYNFSGTLQDITVEHNTKKQLALEVIEQKIAKSKLEESELFSRDVIHNSPVAKIVYTGKDLTISIVNENMLQLLGRTDSILGKTFVEAIPELAGSSLEKRMNYVFETGETFIQAEEKIELIRFGKPHVGYYSYTYKALRKVSGEIYGMMATAIEITDHVEARQKIEAKEKELRDLIIAAPIGICVLSGSPVMVEEVNERFLQISGKTREQFAKTPYWEVLHEVADNFKPVLENVFRSGVKFSTEESEMILIRKGVPETIFATFEYIPVVDIDNIVIKVILMVVEVTHQVETRKKIEAAVIERTKELDESNLNLKRSNAELEQFAYIASHDLQEPIRKISTFTQMLEHSITDINAKSKDYISKIYSSTDRMTKLIRDVLAFSQISSQKDGFETVDLHEVLKNVKTDFELLIEQKKAIVEIEKMPLIQGIPSQMIQLFGNLMSNSLKYTKPNVIPIIKITSSVAKKEIVNNHPQLDQTKKHYHIRFSDNGIGFDQEHADRIFKIFQRLHAKTEFEGTGIGLSVCRKIVQTHQGHISAAAAKNGGAVFNIILPEKI